MMRQTHCIIPAALTALLLFAACEQPSDGKFEGPLNTMASPVDIVATPLSRSSVKIDWKAVTGAAHYTVSRSSSSDGTYIVVGKDIATTTYTDTGLSTSTTYYYRVSAANNQGMNSLPSQSKSATTLEPPRMGTITAALASKNSIALSWEALSDASSYIVSRSGSASGTYTAIANGITTASYTDTSLSAGTYYYKVRALLSDGTSSLESTATSATTYNGLLGDLAYIQASAVNNSEYTIELEADEIIAPTTLSYSGKPVSITLKGKDAMRILTLRSAGSLFSIGSGVKLILGDNITLSGIGGNTGALVRVNTGGTLEMNDGAKISGNTASASASSSSSYSSAYAYARGGGVYVDGGIFTMSGGEISGNTASASSSSSYSSYAYANGGGVYVNGGIFTMKGGEISGNTASASSSSSYAYVYAYGGGVYVDGGIFTMSGGEISGNTASASASSSSSYSYSYATAYGGGVYVASNGTFSKTSAGGTIYGSNATDTTLKNNVSRTEGTSYYGDANGHAVYADANKVRNNTAGADVTLNSAVSGSSGGWE